MLKAQPPTDQPSEPGCLHCETWKTALERIEKWNLAPSNKYDKQEAISQIIEQAFKAPS